MADENVQSGLPATLLQVMQSDEVKNIMKSFSEKTGTDFSGGAEAHPSSIPELSPEIMKKLPEVLSALSGLGIGGVKTSPSAASPALAPMANTSADRQRKALLSALRPYLSPRRKSIVDALLGLEGLTGLLGALSSHESVSKGGIPSVSD